MEPDGIFENELILCASRILIACTLLISLDASFMSVEYLTDQNDDL
jgi:hypothetical protein